MEGVATTGNYTHPEARWVGGRTVSRMRWEQPPGEKGHLPGAVALGTELGTFRTQPHREVPGDEHPDLCPTAPAS